LARSAAAEVYKRKVCYHDLYKINMVKYLPKWVWSIIIIISIPLGGVIYFLLGRETRGENGD
ncbi:PLDc N-terminal domain-containing protein, partial [Staphylococcus pseudintermedius]|uniref:PLDc N-terminal domain-containing protein n=1 Tax=Staphylococcus pseudintermedius TaxID=283734 RepID=UPI001CA445D0